MPGRRRRRARSAAALSGFLTGNRTPTRAKWAAARAGLPRQLLATASPAAFDASDQMPAEVGSGAFWTEGTSFVNGDEDAKTAAAEHPGRLAEVTSTMTAADPRPIRRCR